VHPLPKRVRLIHAPGELRDVELEVLGWRTEDGEVAVNCRLAGPTCRPARRARRRWGCSAPRRPGACSESACKGCASVRARRKPRGKTEANVSGQLGLAISEQKVVAAAVWETLAPQRQQQVALQLARLLAQMVEAERGE
jgi:hypothetical protein